MISSPPSARPIQVADASSVGQARRHAIAVAEYAGLTPEQVGNTSIIATELAVNLHVHGGGGELLINALAAPTPGIQLLAIDRGRGMSDVGRCLVDGYSTAGTAGQGLGAIRRLSSRFDVHSQPGSGTHGGTVVVSQILTKGVPTPGAGPDIGGVCVPVDGETVCGDGWIFDSTSGRCAILVADGLGHGPLAAEAAEAAMAIFRKRGTAEPSAFLTHAHAALRPTRGAAASLADIDLAHRVVRYVGVGNVAGRLVSDQGMRNMISNNGTLGLQIGRTLETQYPWLENGILVMTTDGLVTGWSLDPYPGILRRHPAVIAAVLYRDWSRGRDDATVVVARIPAAAAVMTEV